jgi:DNA invertase Pin-like site-specific DNA recombinase
MSKLQKAVFNGTVKTVVVWKLDRLARSMRDGIDILHNWCELGVRVVSITQELDLSGAVGKLVAGVLFGIAEIEHQHIRERQAAGITLAKKRGIYKGRKAGTTKAKPTRAKELRDQGLKVNEIATALGVSGRTVGNYLKTSL